MLDCERGRGGGGGLSGVGVHCSAHPNIMEPPGGGVERGCSPQGQWLCVSFKVGLLSGSMSETLPLFCLFLLIASGHWSPCGLSAVCPLSVLWPLTLINKAISCAPPPAHLLFSLFGTVLWKPKRWFCLEIHASASESLKSPFCPHSGLNSAKHIDLVPCDWPMTDCWFWLISS